MKRGRRLLLLLLGFGAAIVVVAVCGYEREPRYRGRTLREWVARFEMGMDDGATPAGTVKGREAMEAFHHMRERVLPRAVRLVRYEKPEWKNKVWRFMEMRLHARRWAPRWIWAPFLDDPADEAAICFRMLGANGSPAIPELEALATDPRGGKSAGRAVDALGEIGVEALPALARVATNVRATTRLAALVRINCFDTNAARVAPMLLPCIEDADWRIAGNAAEVVGRLGFEPERSVPAIANLLRRPEPFLRMMAVRSLATFGKEAHSAVPDLTEALNDSNGLVRFAATNALRGIASEVLQKERPPARPRD